MAYETGTASDYKDLLAKLRTFALANGWTSLRHVVDDADGEDEVWLEGEGSGSDHLIVGIRTKTYVAADAHNWELNGAIAFDAGLDFDSQPGNVLLQGLRGPQVTLWDDEIPYWLVGDGRKLRLIAKVSNVYVPMYVGFIDTYASPGQYPYPLAICGSLGWSNDALASSSSTRRWSHTGRELSAWWDGYVVTGTDPSDYTKQAQCRIRLANGAWRGFFGITDLTHQISEDLGGADPHNSGDWQTNCKYPGIWPSSNRTGMAQLRPCLDDTIPLLPVIPMTSPVAPADTMELLGEFDGVYRTSGWGAAAETTVTVDGDDFLIVPNIARSGLGDFTAFRLS